MAVAMGHEQERFAAVVQDLVRLRGGGDLPSYRAALDGVRLSAARMTFLAALNFQNGRRNQAHGSQTDLLHALFSLAEFKKGFEKRYGAALALERDRALNHDAIHRAVELAGFLSREMKTPGAFDLNHAPFIKMKGDYRTACGLTRRTINSRSAPNNISFTPAGTYFTSLLNPDNSPRQVAAAFQKEQELLRTLTTTPLKPAESLDMDATQAFFPGDGQKRSLRHPEGLCV